MPRHRKYLQVLTMFCKAGVNGYNPAMRPIFHALFGVVVLFSFNACQTTPGKQEPNVGPFDSQGRYVDAWADDETKWRPYTPKDVEVDPPRIASNEQPSPNSVPLPTGAVASTQVPPTYSGSGSSRTTTKATGNKPKIDTDRTAKTGSSKTKIDTDRTAKTGSSKTKGDTDRTAKTNSKTKGETDRSTAKTGSSKTKGDTDRTAKTSSKNPSGTAKTATKPKSAIVHHTVKSGDSLYSIAAKYGCSVTALKEANGISGSMIRDGKSLVIPARK